MDSFKNKFKAPKPLASYSHFIKSNNLLFSSGQIGIDPLTNELVNSSFKEEMIQVMNNIKIILNNNSLKFKNIIKVNIYLTDLNNFEMLNKIYKTYFKNKYPVRETVEVSRLPKEANIEISFIAEFK